MRASWPSFRLGGPRSQVLTDPQMHSLRLIWKLIETSLRSAKLDPDIPRVKIDDQFTIVYAVRGRPSSAARSTADSQM